MADIMSKEDRKKTMSRITRKSKLEDQVSKALWARGYRFRKNVKNLRGTPDIAIKKYKVVIFIDSCYWHACPLHGSVPKTNTEFWKNKFEKNKARDKRDREYYEEKGWNIMRIWSHDLKKNVFEDTIDSIVRFIEESKYEVESP
ncbi:very short patch repair endonuclease [Salimicrobium album]|uniref:Very short patch repair endonuclease n=1 Tax=Salimicrobium album TaxID=50717 RepID=A0A1H3E3Z4_9BACI|nr:very short patch repair endonuclease [Salimicrobium album]SDX73330.1 T/G mismatch-specific endonuclease [Salimicrobium album]